MNFNEYFLSFKPTKIEEKKRMILDFNTLYQMKGVKNYSFSDKIHLPYLLFNPNNKLSESMFNNKIKQKDVKDHLIFHEKSTQMKTPEKFKCLRYQNNKLTKLLPIKLNPISKSKISSYRDNEIKGNLISSYRRYKKKVYIKKSAYSRYKSFNQKNKYESN